MDAEEVRRLRDRIIHLRTAADCLGDRRSLQRAVVVVVVVVAAVVVGCSADVHFCTCLQTGSCLGGRTCRLPLRSCMDDCANVAVDTEIVLDRRVGVDLVLNVCAD